MFRAFANYPVIPPGTINSVRIPFGTRSVFGLHPVDIVSLLELAWDKRQARGTQGEGPGRPFNRSGLTRFHDTLWGNPSLSIDPADLPGGQSGFEQLRNRLLDGTFVPCDHLIYAYMIENTRIVPIMRRRRV